MMKQILVLAPRADHSPAQRRAPFAQLFAPMLWALSLLLAMTRPARADDLSYSKLDEATVRVFSFKTVALTRARSKGGRSYALGAPDAGHGSGVIINKDGLILTARHVVEDARWVAVQLPGRDHPLPAKVVYTDKDHDTAFLSVGIDTPQFIELPAQKPKLAVRETVYVVGYPLDASRVRPQSEQGIVSGVLPDGSLQLGIALNPGNSGGPVVDAKERFIGIAVARADPRAGAQGIGVAVPVEHILPAYSNLQKSRDYAATRTALAKQPSDEQARAELLMTILTADDSNSAWQALSGKSEASPSSPSVDKVIKSISASGEENADALALAAAQEWNAAAVLESRHQSNESRLAAARKLAKRAAALDSSIGERSPFIAFVLDGKEPHSASPKGGDDDGDGEEGGEPSSEDEAAARQRFMDSLELKREIPSVRAGIGLGIQAPYQVLAFTVTGKFRFGQRLTLDARYGVGWHMQSSDTSLSHFGEASLGFALGNWQGETNARLIVDVDRRVGLTVFHYVPAKIPTSHSLVAEVGAVTGKLNFVTSTVDNTGSTFSNTEAKQILIPQVGVRYTYFYSANSEYMVSATRGGIDLAAHLMGPIVGVPDKAHSVDGPEVKTSVGGNVDFGWLAGHSQTEVGLGYLPHGEWVIFRLGWSWLWY